MNRFFFAVLLMFCLTNTAWSEQGKVSIETQYAPNEIDHVDFFSLNLTRHLINDNSSNTWPAHLYAQINYSGFTHSATASNHNLRNFFVGMGAEYHAVISPYIEAGISADTIILTITDIILDDMFDNDCREQDNCLSNGGDTYITVGARLFLNQNFTIGAFIESISFENPDSESYSNYTVTGMNMRILF